MKVLHIMPYSPYPPIHGGAIRVLYLLKHLAQHHDVSVVCFGEEKDADRLKSVLNCQLDEVYTVHSPWTRMYRRPGQLYSRFTSMSYLQTACYSTDMQKKIDEILAEQDFDLVFSEFCMMGWYQLKTNALKILDAHNIEHDNYSRMVKLEQSLIKKNQYISESKKLRCEEIATFKRQNALFATSQRDTEIIESLAPGIPKFVIPNGVDTSYFVPNITSVDPHSMVFTGMMGYTPNSDGMLYFLDEIFPMITKEIPDAKITIVGNNPPAVLQKRASDNVIVTGYVDDVRPYVWNSKAYVVPLRMGGGTRLKVCEAMSMKKPIITTSIGCEGIDVESGKHVFIADTPGKFARMVINVLQDRSDHARLVENGYKLVRSVYDWSVICHEMETILQKLRDDNENCDQSEVAVSINSFKGG
ncbi:MAG: glycosyltransferase [Bacteroidota bacterium]